MNKLQESGTFVKLYTLNAKYKDMKGLLSFLFILIQMAVFGYALNNKKKCSIDKCMNSHLALRMLWKLSYSIRV